MLPCELRPAIITYTIHFIDVQYYIEIYIELRPFIISYTIHFNNIQYYVDIRAPRPPPLTLRPFILHEISTLMLVRVVKIRIIVIMVTIIMHFFMIMISIIKKIISTNFIIMIIGFIYR